MITNDMITIIKYIGPGGTVRLPETLDGLPVACIGDSAFANDPTITQIVMPDQVVAIGPSAFRNCANLTHVSLSKRVTELATNTFRDCKALDRIDLPQGLLRIGAFAFWGCPALPRISIPDSVVELGDSAFAYCHKLQEVTLPRSVTAIGPNPFRNCNRLSHLTVAADNPTFCSIDGVLWDKARFHLIGYPSSRTGDYQIPEGTASVSQYAFRGAFRLMRVTVPASVRQIDFRAFRYCRGIYAFIFEGDAPALGYEALQGCSVATIYRRPDAKGWGATFGDRPVKVWASPAPSAITRDGEVIYEEVGSAPSEARRFLRGASPRRVRTSHPLVPSVGTVEEESHPNDIV